MTERYSVYHVPSPAGKLYATGAAILGRCIRTGAVLEPPWPKFFSAALPPHPARAAVYGFHATIVAPFRSMVSAETLAETLKTMALKTDPFSIGPLELSLLEPGFPALIPKSAPPDLTKLEERLVKTFSNFSFPAGPAEVYTNW